MPALLANLWCLMCYSHSYICVRTTRYFILYLYLTQQGGPIGGQLFSRLPLLV